jgi:hypothetical protein
MATETEQAPPQLPVAPSLVRDAAINELGRATDLVQVLTLEQWGQPSAVAGWSVGHVVTHLEVVLGVYAQVIDAVLAGRGAGPLWRTFSRLSRRVVPTASPALNRVNSAIPRMVGAAVAPEVLKGQFAATSRRMRARLERIGPGDYTRPTHYMGRPWPLSFLLSAMVNEIALHGWDVASRLDPSAHLGQDARSVVPWFYFGGTAYLFHPPEGMRATIAVQLTDPDAEMWWTIADGITNQGVGALGEPTATIRGEAGTFVLVLAGRIGPKDAVLSTSLSLEGDEAAAEAFLGSWRIV